MQNQVDSLVVALQTQRNRALDDFALTLAQLMVARQRVEELEAQVEKHNKLLGLLAPKQRENLDRKLEKAETAI